MRAKREGVKALKLICGYGSSGKGGALCVGRRTSFGQWKKKMTSRILSRVGTRFYR
jgi:hypothetical protein